MGLQFERAVGAGADVKELEYIVALLQTSVALRSNATVSSRDILAQLKSRYLLTISHEEAIYVVRSLGGGDTDTVREDDLVAESGFDLGNAKEAISSSISGAYGRLKNTFHSQTSHASREDNQYKRGSSDHGTSAARSNLTSTSKAMMNRLGLLHACHRNGGMSQQDLMAIQDELVANLRAKVVKKTFERAHATRRLVITPDDSNEFSIGGSHGVLETSSEPKNLNFVIVENECANCEIEKDETDLIKQAHDFDEDDSVGTSQLAPKPFSKPYNPEIIKEDMKGAESDTIEICQKDGIYSVEEAPERQKLPRSTYAPEQAPEGEISPVFMAESEEEKTPELKESPGAEYLDLVQLLSTLLIPKFARVAHDIKVAKSPFDEVDQNSTTSMPKDPSLFAKLKKRFIAYGRRKLQIKDDDIVTYSAEDLIKIALKAFLKGFPEQDAPVLDETLVQLLLISFGEVERANDAELVQEMVDAARTPMGLFNQDALVQAISSDLLGSWDPTCEDTPMTFFHDVFREAIPSTSTKLKADETQNMDYHSASFKPQPKISQLSSPVLSRFKNERSNTLEDIEEVKAEPPGAIAKTVPENKPRFSTTLLGIDMVIDSCSSLVVYVLVWLSYILNAAALRELIVWAPDSGKCSEYSCIISVTVAHWTAVACVLVALGFYHILPLSAGNNPASQSMKSQVIACVVTLINTIVSLIVLASYAPSSEEDPGKTDLISAVNGLKFAPFFFLNLSVGITLAFLFAVRGLDIYSMNHDNRHLPPLWHKFLTAISAVSTPRNVEVHNYPAAKFKTERLVSNALRLHCMEECVIASHYANKDNTPLNLPLSRKTSLYIARDRATRNFILHGEGRQTVGGVFWTFWRLCDRSLLDNEGIWLHTRLIVFQISQFLLGGVLLYVLVYATTYVAEEADRQRASIEDQLLPDWVMEIFPTGEMIESSWMPAAYFCMVVIFSYMMIYVPSTITTILKYRDQELPSFGSPHFQKYRENVDLAHLNTVNAIYGMIGGVLLIYSIFGLIIFLFVYPITTETMKTLVAWVIGLVITILVKKLITTSCRKVQYRAFFRVKPAAANISALALECWHIGLASSVLIARITQFTVGAMFWVGRCDVPFMSNDVDLFGLPLDQAPTHYFRDLLLHEAHRHPYVERMFQMYLMKLHHGDHFVSKAGSVWRQLLVLAIFPWMAKYRVFSDERRLNAKIEAKQFEAMKENEQDPYLGVKGMKNNVIDGGIKVEEEIVEIGQEICGIGEDIVMEVGKIAKKGGTAVAGGATKGGTSVVLGGCTEDE